MRLKIKSMTLYFISKIDWYFLLDNKIKNNYYKPDIITKGKGYTFCFIKKKKKIMKRGALYLLSTSKLLVQCTNNFVIFYVKWFWIILYIYYKEKVNQIRVKKHIHFKVLKISLVASLHICTLLKLRFFKKKKKKSWNQK